MQTEYGRSYAELYNKHWWWRARESILTRLISKLSLPANAEILDVGCGDALFFPELRKFGKVRGIETDVGLLRADGPERNNVFTKPLGDPAYDSWRFDLITALDVVEHIEDDRRAVEQMVRMLKPRGYLVITVPAFMSLWDEHDELNRHYRRYTLPQLTQLLSGLGVLRESRYLFHGIFVPKYLVSQLNRSSTRKVSQTAVPPRVANWAMSTFCDLEERITHRLQLPFGTSALAVLQRSEHVES